MADSEPILFRRVFGSLRPVTPAAEEWLAALPAHAVRIEAKNIKGNTKRIALYWICLKKACELLSDAVEGTLNRKALHRWLKREEGLAHPIKSKKTGEVIDWDYESIAFENMPEHQRSEFITAALERISRRLGCDVTTLEDEARADFGEAA